jgi:aminocarboxymuconate-semialdehyde decarboxylase
MEILRKRTDIPRVVTVNKEDRLIILPGEDAEITTSTGRPIGREYFDIDYKIRFVESVPFAWEVTFSSQVHGPAWH